MTVARDKAEMSRRRLMASGAAALCVAPAFTLVETARAEGGERSPQFTEAFNALLAGRTPLEGGVTVELPGTAENGNFVPITIAVASPMTAEDHVTAIHLLSTANPAARVATFHLAPINAVARVQSRMRLAKTQDVVVLAELSTGAVHIATTPIEVAIGGCG